MQHTPLRVLTSHLNRVSHACMTLQTPAQPTITIRGIHHIARFTGVSHHKVRAAVRDGSLPKLANTGRDTIVLREDAEAWVRSLRPATPERGTPAA